MAMVSHSRLHSAVIARQSESNIARQVLSVSSLVTTANFITSQSIYVFAIFMQGSDPCWNFDWNGF